METRLELLENDWARFKENNTKLHEKFKAEECKTLVDMYDSTEESYITYKCLLKSLLNKCRSVNSSEKSGSNDTSKCKGSVKLPKITIPTFSGKYSEWTTFRDLFLCLVDKNESLDNVEKMHYLKSHLTGEAEQFVRHKEISDLNYAQCWAKLEKRYSNKKYLSNCILKRLFSQKRMLVESAAGLKELLDTTNDCLSALTNLNVDVSTWDIIIIHIVTFKLDPETRKQWELTTNSNDINELPTYEQFATFLENRFRAFERIEPNKVHQVTRSHVPKAMVTTSSSKIRCEYCSDSHKLCFCKKFANQPVDSRRDFVVKHNICFNCLGSNHSVYNCKKQTNCKVCLKRHHSLLHPSGESVKKDQDIRANVMTVDASSSASVDHVVACLSTNKVPRTRQVLLATALVKAESKGGDFQLVRVLLDQGSQACLITEATVQYLRLPKIPIQGIVSGLGNSSTVARYMVQIKIQSRIDPHFNLQVTAYVLTKITSYLPEQSINKDILKCINISSNDLADPQFNQPNKIDILLGADAYSCILKEGIRRSSSSNLIAQNTNFGWILSGAVNNSNENSNFTHNNINVMHTQIREEDVLKRFWEIEEQINNKKILTPDEQKCEEFYAATTSRREDGRYVVRLPFRIEVPQFEDTRSVAEIRFKSLEKRLEKDKELKEKYTSVIKEYLQLDHMRPVNDNKGDVAVYLPHHAVIRNDKTTTKVRVVFNASEKYKSGVSLNDTLIAGPSLQADLRHTVLRWRVHPIGLVADIVKMYRQIRIADEDTKYQRILWRDSPNKEIRDYELLTVTFGTTSAPYQAVRTLHQIVYDEGKVYPLAAEKVLNCFYMDDLMTGCYNVEEGLVIYKEMTELLGKGGFLLQKWNSNNEEIINKINEAERQGIQNQLDQKQIVQQQGGQKQIDQCTEMETRTNQQGEKNNKDIEDKGIDHKIDNVIKILGLSWNRSIDAFQYTVNLPPQTTAPVTKRAVISNIARLFDPLGWLAPSVVIAKIFIQKLWLAGIEWDEELNPELKQEWNTYRQELSHLTQIAIPRWLGTNSNDDRELHGFCDASKAAYSAVVYLRMTDVTGKVNIALLVAKTRVAPIKQISIPRLELCGAVLLSKLLMETAEVLQISTNKIFAWTDSTVVLAWLNSHPSRWKTFVANRTSEILTSMQPSQWFHVSTTENPADCASRGLLPSLLVENSLWFSGPTFLSSTIIYKKQDVLKTDLEQTLNVYAVVASSMDGDIFQTFERYSSLSKLLRVIAYCRRFKNKGKNDTDYLQKKELEKALECCIRRTQEDTFKEEYVQLQDKGFLRLKKSKLRSLCPYLDENGLIRVKGRLEKSSLDEQMKHPIVLPNNTHLTRLIVADAHIKTLHGGNQLMLNYLRSAYWILGARNLVKRHINKCVTCAKQRASTKAQIMGDLPSVRCNPSRPFLHSGVDYAGPINVRTTKGRGHHSYKGYICLFVCMSTRALHLEVVSDMGTQAFLAAFRRFVSRRGHCAKLYSDNGTTFVGASRELQRLAPYQTSIAQHLEANNTEWHFIPPHAPNFGGLWEAGVKSTKFHLKRVIGDATLTYEELTTLLTQVEACLNSRPISVMNLNDPGEPIPLTPGHFLIGEPIISIPEYSNYESSNVHSLTRWQFVQRMLQSFWRRWSQEYLSNLMHRYKWSSKAQEPKIGDIVLIKEDDMPPSRWLMGRIIEKHPGDDKITRVVTLRTKSSSIIKRPTNKLCILPVFEE
ncbi:uncharacterized protein LOC123721318 [Papilio machaon]|uniref:uncharacterized protein LOC123721318 n=1 Tax=Papilio machaon TaxID=76193 RepID=UPI001E665623|nr:uncharacterized protein LOC123721318 [Papilio machaon]